MADFKQAIELTLVHEGGYVNNIHDAGGETNMGISKRQYPNLDIKNLTQDQAIEIYREGYWKPLYSQINDQPIANKLFDLGVLFGVGAAVKTLQTALSIVSDGAFGPTSLAVTNAMEPVSLLVSFKTQLVSHAVRVVAANPGDRIFFAGWTRRINS